MRRPRSPLVGIAASLWLVAASASATLPPRVRALYGIDRGGPPLRGKSPAEVAAWLKRHGFNAAFGAHRDAALAQALAQAGIQRYAELALFVGERHWRRHPESRPIGADGLPLPRRGWYAGVCPNQPWLIEAKLREVERLLRGGRVDGIWLDFVRFPGRWEERRPTLAQSCFCPRCLRALAEAGIAPGSGDPSSQARFVLERQRDRFAAWKCARIAEVVRQVRDRIRRVRPGTLLGLFTVPWRRGEQGDARRAIFGQDPALLGPLVDVVSPMAYHLMLGKPPSWIAELATATRVESGKPVLPVVQACSIPGRLSDAAFLAAARSAAAPPSAGVIVFSQRHFARERREAAWLRAFGEPAP